LKFCKFQPGGHKLVWEQNLGTGRGQYKVSRTHQLVLIDMRSLYIYFKECYELAVRSGWPPLCFHVPHIPSHTCRFLISLFPDLDLPPDLEALKVSHPSPIPAIHLRTDTFLLLSFTLYPLKRTLRL